MPKKIDPALRDGAVRLLREHRSEYPSLPARSVSAMSPCAGVNRPGFHATVLLAASSADGLFLLA